MQENREYSHSVARLLSLQVYGWVVMYGSVCLSNIFQMHFGATAAGTGAGTDLTGLCLLLWQKMFPQGGEDALTNSG